MVEKDRIGNSKYKNIGKNQNEIVKILAKSKIQNLPKLIFRNSFLFKKL